MYVVNRSVHKRHWEPVLKRLAFAFARGAYERIGTRPVYKLRWINDRYVVYVAAKKIDGVFHIYGWYFLEEKGLAWHIIQSYVFEDHRGQGWSKVMYNAMINGDQLVLASGPTQTNIAIAMWKGIVRSGRFTTFAYDFKNDILADVMYDPENDELYSELQLYDTHWNYHTARRDVRIIAIRKEQHDHGLRRSSQSNERGSVHGLQREARQDAEVLHVRTTRTPAPGRCLQLSRVLPHGHAGSHADHRHQQP